MNYWLMKSEPECYGIDDLKKDGVTPWDGVRNYQARNYMRDEMRVGDLVFFYHSNAKPSGIAGVGKVVGKAHPDHSQFDPQDEHFDPTSDPEQPRWVCVDVGFVEKFPRVIPLSELKADSALSGMRVTQKGDRLSVQPVAEKDFLYIREKLSGR